MINSPELNAVGSVALILSALNSFFQMFNPLLTGIFYMLSISWLLIQIIYKLKNKK